MRRRTANQRHAEAVASAVRAKALDPIPDQYVQDVIPWAWPTHAGTLGPGEIGYNQSDRVKNRNPAVSPLNWPIRDADIRAVRTVARRLKKRRERDEVRAAREAARAEREEKRRLRVAA
jgi:hypothetical protein